MEETANPVDVPERPQQPELHGAAAGNAKASQKMSGMGKLLQWAVYPFSAVAGLYTGYIHVRNAAYDNVKWTGALADEKGDYTRKMYAEGAKARAVLAAGQEFDFPAATKSIASLHDTKITENLKQLKVGSLPKQWGVNSLYQKQNAVMAAATAAGIGVAVGAMLTDSRLFRNWFAEKPENQEQAR